MSVYQPVNISLSVLLKISQLYNKYKLVNCITNIQLCVVDQK